MRIALVGAEFEENLAVRYIRGTLEAAGHEVVQVVFNEPAELERAARELVDSRAPLAGMSLVFTYRARQFAMLARRARELGFAGHLTAGGHFAAFNAEWLLERVAAFDSVVCGEGERPMLRLAERLDRLGEVEGLVWRRADGVVVRNPRATNPPDLDELPWPVHRKPYDRYLGLPIANVLGSRGCTHACAFCSIAAWHRHCGGPRLRLRRPERVAEEMAALYRDGVRVFNFHDDNFVLDSRARTFDRVRALERALRERGVGRIAFAIKARPDEVDEELFAYLQSIGLFRVFLGIEAGTEASLRRLGRGQTLSDNERALDVVNTLDIHACFNLLIFNPDSVLEDVIANAAFLRSRPRNPMNFCRTEIYAGTPLERRLREQGRRLGDPWGYDYEIADPRAQLAFEVIYAAFRDRNYGEQGLHHRTMRVDYEHQLLGHFWGRDDALWRRTKAFVVAANLDTCGFLDEALAAVGRGFPDEAAARAYAAELHERVERSGARLAREADALLEAFRAALLERQRRPRVWLQKAAAAGLAATLAVVPVACKKESGGASHPTEEVALPTDAPSFATEMVAPPLPDVATTAEPDGGSADAGESGAEASRAAADAPATEAVPAAPEAGGPAEAVPAPEALATAFEGQAMFYLAEHIAPARDLQVELTLDGRGEVTHATLYAASVAADVKREALAFLRSLSFGGTGVPAGRYRLDVTRRMLEEALQRGTQIFEEVPYPTQMHERAPAPPTHIREMAPEPLQRGLKKGDPERR